VLATLIALLAVGPVLMPFALAGNGGGRGGGKGGGGGDDGGGGSGTPPAPEIAYIEAGALWVMDADGSNATPIFTGGSVSSVSWSPDGTRFAIMANIGGLTGVWTLDADGSNLQLVTETHVSTYSYKPQWSPAPTPDGFEYILFIDLTDEGPDGNYDVYAIHPDGTGLVPLVETPVPFMEGDCAWSPDATRIAVIEDWAGDTLTLYDLGLVDGSLAVIGSEVIADTPPDLADLDWARTQNKVAVTSFVEGTSNNRELWILDLDDPSNHRRLTYFEHQDRSPTWSPDDSFLVFERFPRPGKEIGLRRIRGDGQLDVSLGVKYGGRPDWRR
jgi:Tol biopolymer transport system component